MPLSVFFLGLCVAAPTTEARTWLIHTTITYIRVVGAAEAQSKTPTTHSKDIQPKLYASTIFHHFIYFLFSGLF